ncbi:DUF3800 domain-containing protein [Enterovibrio norvegicus]|uniref:DUF3800 domain-containing protein n=1 Tax=Enterovibrio norvegicus TaxID=188144 RepID=UPI0002D791C8|nr:DUF3800 domain-containing protein [Enterovibrio norvegicus]OEE69236.1 hypothetical protein A1OO_00845 [Enterovibrio norvegicus FF-33]PML76382.1 hypothetical protein BCT69_23540 [Enterovibrio norvegicus]PMN71257.1 hypothetical protein BCT27_17010 [Enterovibrio norvegicus]
MKAAPETYFLFIDDSGSPCPDRIEPQRRDGLDAFALGGFLIQEKEVERVKELHKALMVSQGFECPEGTFKHHLHSTKIRCKKKHFDVLKDQNREAAFIDALNSFICELPIIAHACVVDRQAYRLRYDGVYQDKWGLCRSAYQILIERAVKFVRSVGGRKLIVYVEKTGPKEDRKIQNYHDNLLTQGMEFDVGRSSTYSPIGGDEISAIVSKKVKFQTKDSRLMQIADLVLYPLIKAGYNPEYPPYKLLMQNKKVVDCVVEDISSMGVKYYCFPPERQKAT